MWPFQIERIGDPPLITPKTQTRAMCPHSFWTFRSPALSDSRGAEIMKPLGPSSKDIYFGPVSSRPRRPQPQYVVASQIDHFAARPYPFASLIKTIDARMSPL